VAVEADKTTFDILSQNVAGHSQIHPLHAAVWSHENGVDLAPPSTFGSWAGRVEESLDGLTPSRLLSSTFAHIPNARPLIVKLDVEGAEREICSAAKDVLAEAPCILIEPHDFMLPGHGCLQHLFRALADRELDTLIMGENLMFIQSDLSQAPPHIS
jgi:FkbM family methyltransferase